MTNAPIRVGHADLHVERLGQGPPVVLVHGSVLAGLRTWDKQRNLARRWRLIIPDRPGFGRSRPADRIDFDVDAELVAELLGVGAHLVGHSYGGVIALLTAAIRPDAVRSLTLVEPPAFSVAAADPRVAPLLAKLVRHWESPRSDPERFLRKFLSLVGAPPLPPGPLPAPLAHGARMLVLERGPWEAEIPTARLAGAPFTSLVVSGDHHPAFEALCDELARQIQASREVLPGAGHAVQRVGPFNERLETFLLAAEPGS